MNYTNLPTITLALNLAFYETTDFETATMNGAAVVPIEIDNGNDAYWIASERYGIFMDINLNGALIRACYGRHGMEEFFIVKEDDINKRITVKITYAAANKIDESYIQVRRSNGDNSSMHFGDLPIDVQNAILMLNAAQETVEQRFAVILA